MRIDIGDFVCCDFCNAGENSLGGVIIGSNAICGDCCEKNGYYKPDYEFKDEISEFLSVFKTFKNNVLEYRKKTTGTTSGEIIIESF